MSSITLSVIDGEDYEAADFRCVAGEDLTITLRLIDSSGAAVSLAGKSVVLGWEDRETAAAKRYPVPGDSSGIATWSFTPQQTIPLVGGCTHFDVVVEHRTERDQTVPVCTASFSRSIAPLPTAIYYGEGEAGLTSVATLAESTAYLGFPFSVQVSPVAQYVYLAWPATWGNAYVTVDGFEFDAISVQTIAVGGVSYKLLQSTNALTSTGMDIDVIEDTS
jgi:hypothetical protein